jgi:hypothetical protein
VTLFDSMTSSRRRLAPALGLVLLGCAPEEEFPLPPIVWEGQSVRVRMDDPDIQVCGGSFEALDRHAQLVREALLLEGDEVVEYSIGDQDFVDAACDPDSLAACTNATTGRVFTKSPLHQHEVVHAVRVLDPEIGVRSSPIEEGLSTVFGSDSLGANTVPLDAWGILEDPRAAGGAEHYRAGHTVAFLLERHGAEGFRRFDERARDTAENDAFAEIFGETKEEFAAAADAAPHCEQSQWWAPLLECDGEPMVADAETGAVTLTGNLRCGEADVQGPQAGRMWTSRHFRLDEPTTGTLAYSFDFPEDATLEIVGCTLGCPERFAYIGTRYQVSSFGNGLPRLEPGEYFLRMSRPVADDDGQFEVILD